METLQSEINALVESLPYWQKYIAEKILSGSIVSDAEVKQAYNYLLEDLTLLPVTEKNNIAINYSNNSGNYKSDLKFVKLENVEGVNALSENHPIEFSPNITIIYGANGSGKSSYVRLMKKVFNSKAPEEIIPNIHLQGIQKPINGQFEFTSDGENISLNYPPDSGNVAFTQFSVFDGKCVLRHLDQRNEFEFRPSGLCFFTDFTNAVIRIENELTKEIREKLSANEFSYLFDGESRIKTFVESLSEFTTAEELQSYTPYSDDDKAERSKIEESYDELLLTFKSKDKEIKALLGIKELLNSNKHAIEIINSAFTTENLIKIQNAILDYIQKDSLATTEGIQNFQTYKIDNIGSIEWKNFIISAERFSQQQLTENSSYPKIDDNCLFCHQPLTAEAQKLINSYWIFIKSEAEQNAKNSELILTSIKNQLTKLDFNLFPEENRLSIWLNEKYSTELQILKVALSRQKQLTTELILDINSKTANRHDELQTNTLMHDTIISAIDESIALLNEDEQHIRLKELLNAKITLAHKEKFNIHLDRLEAYIKNKQWISKANTISWQALKTTITTTEKRLSVKYFNQTYIDKFNQECENLNGNFDVVVNHTGSGGTSYRQLSLKGNTPGVILSEGEQKVIALADFISETHLSEANRGIIFDDPVNSLDESRKKDIALRLIKEARIKQVIIFTHDLIFVSNLITSSEESRTDCLCHWIETRDGIPGHVWLRNSPSYEKEYRNAEPAKKFYRNANMDDCPPEQREYLIKAGFTALRTCYEVLVINDLFNNVVQRYNERVSMEALSTVNFDKVLINELLDSFSQCCRYMEGHTHSDTYSYKKPQPTNLYEEIVRYEATRKKLKDMKKTKL